MRDPPETVNLQQRPSDRIRDVIWVINRLAPDRTDPERFFAWKDWAVKTLRVLLHSGDLA
jgi:hypothetical protein